MPVHKVIYYHGFGQLMICKIWLGFWKWGDIKQNKSDSIAELSAAEISKVEIKNIKIIAAEISKAKMIAAGISKAFVYKRL